MTYPKFSMITRNLIPLPKIIFLSANRLLELQKIIIVILVTRELFVMTTIILIAKYVNTE